MGQNNDPTERGELQGNQGGLLSKNPAEHEKLRAKEEGYPSARKGTVLRPERRETDPAPPKP